jgi:lysophospholipase L1-like esterase
LVEDLQKIHSLRAEGTGVEGKPAGGFQFLEGQRVVFAGDSITDCGSRSPAIRAGLRQYLSSVLRRLAGRATGAPFGNGYVRQTVDLITARYPDRALTLWNAGVAGNTVLDLERRWDADVLQQDPDWISILVGINDIVHTVGEHPERAIPVEQYGRAYRRLIEQSIEQTGARLILIDPFFISTDQDEPIMKLLPEYLETVRGLAAEFGALHVRTHSAFQHALRFHPPARFCPEPVHPNLAGHHLITQELLRAIGW